MNNILSAFARQDLKENLETCTDGQQMVFKRMYSFRDPALAINEVVDNMPDGKLDWAMQQVRATCKKNVAQAAEAAREEE